MASQSIAYNPQTLKRELLEQSIHEWSQALKSARNALFGHEWPQAVMQYWRAYPMAEQLIKESTCKNCAVKGYTRTLTELAYALRKNQQQEKLSAVIELAKPTLHTELSSTLAQELVAIMTNIAYGPIQDIDAWMDGLFAMDSSMSHSVH
ncbi:MAG: hypothetical protein U5M23_04385 [Marinagarivorans sp.]|nr:hypothetical protein [Marinagarivorans sp.]